MIDFIIEIVRTISVGMIMLLLLLNPYLKKLNRIGGWYFIVMGLLLVYAGMLLDITDDSDSLAKYVVLGPTEYESFLENVIGYLGGFTLLAMGLWFWIPRVIELERRKAQDLEKAEEEIKALSGLLPICACCKKIRDDRGYWNQIESYIRERSEADFSHGICPECEKLLYPELQNQKTD